MAERSKIRKLPAEIRQKVEDALAEGRATYDEIVDFLTGEGHEVSRSSVWRFDQGFQETLKQMRETREMVAAFVRESAEFKDLFEGDFGAVLQQMMQHIVFRQLKAEIEGGAPAIDPQDLMLTARALREVAAALKLNSDTTRRKIEIAQVREKVQVDKDAAETDLSPGIDLPGNSR